MASEEQSEPEQASVPRTKTNKVKGAKQQHQDIFARWLEKKALQQDDAILESTTTTELEHCSLGSLLAQQESKPIIADPREYQLELFERAKAKNTIAVLDTGSGKTLIAILLLRHVLDQEVEDRAAGKRPRLSFFLVNSALLVFHQYAVLDSNLDQPIDRFCGEMGCDLWDAGIWQSAFSKSKVIVCTADILDQCLMHSFISMSDINLLIFDEAHHAKKNHVYSRIMKDHYEFQDAANRPRIFAMTASPVDARDDAIVAAQQLESTLHSCIATASDLTILRYSKSRPTEHVVAYESLTAPFDVALTSQLRPLLGKLDVFRKAFSFAPICVSQLGEACGKMFWKAVLEENEIEKIEPKLQDGPVPEQTAHDWIAESRKLVDAYPSDETSISSKLKTLTHILASHFTEPNNNRCLIFVARRMTAKLLHEYLQKAPIPHLHTEPLVGASATEIRSSIRQQVLLLSRFRLGQVNCLIATSVAEEGFDVPDCNIAIRFDLCATMIQYIQSRGRVRQSPADFYHLVERDNAAHYHSIQSVRRGEQKMKDFCKALPADRLLKGPDEDEAQTVSDFSERYVESATGATLTWGSSQAVLAHFVSRLPKQTDDDWSIIYNILPQNVGYICEVILPENSPLHSAMGCACLRKSAAKRAAAFTACCQLREMAHLDANLLPIYHKLLPKMRNARLALNDKKTNEYPKLTKPHFWDRDLGLRPRSLYLTIIRLSRPPDTFSSVNPIALLTRFPLGLQPSVSLFLEETTTTDVEFDARGSLDISEGMLADLTIFTLCIFRDVFNKTFEHDETRMSYWLASIDGNSELDWEAIREHDADLRWNPQDPTERVIDRYLIDRLHGGRRFLAKDIDNDLKPSDPAPDIVPRSRHTKSILQFTTAMSAAALRKIPFAVDQPVFRGEKLSTRLNWLAEASQDYYEPSTPAYICAEPLRISPLRMGFVSMMYLFPSIITRIDDILLSVETCTNVGLTIEPMLAYEALAKSANVNYERLEFLGDCFLKLATSISLYVLMPQDQEFEFHVKRMVMVSNRNLLKSVKDHRIHESIRIELFSRRTWYPESLNLLQGKSKATDTKTQRLADKTIADVGEAIIGASLLTDKTRDLAVKAVTLFVSNPDHTAERWSDYLAAYERPPFQMAPSTASQVDLAQQIELRMGYKFRYPRLLRSAFLHGSYAYAKEGVPCYQRLEFLGDALLDMTCVNFLFHEHPDKDPQWLTEHKMAMVSNRFLAAVSVKLGFHKHLRFTGSAIQSRNAEYIAAVEDAEAQNPGKCDFWRNVPSPPKALSDIVESFVGAMFVDSDFDYSTVQCFFTTYIRPYFEDMSIYDTFANNHPVTFLHTLLAVTLGCMAFRLMASEVPSSLPDSSGKVAKSTRPLALAAVLVHGTVVADGGGDSTKSAKVVASQNALDLLQGLSLETFREKYSCDCHLRSQPAEDTKIEVFGTAI